MPPPPVPPVLQNQLSLGPSVKDETTPHFSSLYRYVTSTCLDIKDASTRSTNKVYEKSGASERLRDVWIQKATENIIVRALREICVSHVEMGRQSAHDGDVPIGLTSDLKELGYIISLFISAVTSSSSTMGGTGQVEINREIDDLIADEIESFVERLPRVCIALDQYITDLEQTIKSMAETIRPSSSTSTERRRIAATSHIPKTAPSASSRPISDRQYGPSSTTSANSTTTSSSLISAHRTRQTENLNTLSELLVQINLLVSTLSSQHTNLLQSRIRTLERHTHSTLSRHLTTQASFLSTVSQGISTKLSLLSLLDEKETYAEDGLRPALDNRFHDLTVLDGDLAERERRLRILLAEYDHVGSDTDTGPGRHVGGGGNGKGRGGAGEDIMKKLGAEYKRIEEEIEMVKMDVRKLENQSVTGGARMEVKR